MNYLHYALALIALLGLIPTVVYLLPGHPAHFLPALTAGLALLVYFIPTPIDAALSLVVPATLLIRLMPIDPVPSEKLNYKPFAGWCKSAAATVLSRLPRRHREPEQPVTEFAKHAYPGPATVQDDDAGAVDDEPGELEPPAMQTQVRRFVKPLFD